MKAHSTSGLKSDYGISVIVCTYNGSARLASVLVSLQSQKGIDAIPIEVVVVNNASTDNTVQVAAQSWSNSQIDFKVILEDRPGLNFAREAGYRATRYSLICWVDDDNILSPGYLAKAAEMMSIYPHAAVCGGRGFMTSPAPIPTWLREEWGIHGCGVQGDVDGPVPDHRSYVYYACAVVRREAMEELYAMGFKSLMMGRQGAGLTSGDDNEVCYALKFLGWQIIQSQQLTFEHIMPPQRLTWEYCLRLLYAIGQGAAVTNLYLSFCGETFRRRLKRTWVGVQLACVSDCYATLAHRREPGPVGSHAVLERYLLHGRRDMLIQLWKNGRLRKYYLEIRDLYNRCWDIRLSREKLIAESLNSS